jgi:hypothetical protein
MDQLLLRGGDTRRKAEEDPNKDMEEGREMMAMGKVAITRAIQQAPRPHLFEQDSIRTASNTRRLKHQAVAHLTMARLAEESLDPRLLQLTEHPHNDHIQQARLSRRARGTMMDTATADMGKATDSRIIRLTTALATFTMLISMLVVCLVPF